MKKNTPLESNELWIVVELLLPQEPSKPKGGRPWVSARAALSGSIFVLKSGIPWEMLRRNGLCQRDDVLATAARLATGGGLGTPPLSDAHALAGCRQTGLAAGLAGQCEYRG